MTMPIRLVLFDMIVDYVRPYPTAERGGTSCATLGSRA